MGQNVTLSKVVFKIHFKPFWVILGKTSSTVLQCQDPSRDKCWAWLERKPLGCAHHYKFIFISPGSPSSFSKQIHLNTKFNAKPMSKEVENPPRRKQKAKDMKHKPKTGTEMTNKIQTILGAQLRHKILQTHREVEWDVELFCALPLIQFEWILAWINVFIDYGKKYKKDDICHLGFNPPPPPLF